MTQRRSGRKQPNAKSNRPSAAPAGASSPPAPDAGGAASAATRASRPAGDARTRVSKQEAARQAREQQQRRHIQAISAGGLALLVLIAFFVYRGITNPEPGERIPPQGRTHIQEGETHPPYNSNPPTSGWHNERRTVPAGMYSSPQPDEYLVHSLEHGYIVVSYNCDLLTADQCTTLTAQLEDLARREPRKLAIVPRPNLDVPLALTAWERLARLPQYDEAFIMRFIHAYRDKGPENPPE